MTYGTIEEVPLFAGEWWSPRRSVSRTSSIWIMVRSFAGCCSYRCSFCRVVNGACCCAVKARQTWWLLPVCYCDAGGKEVENG